MSGPQRFVHWWFCRSIWGATASGGRATNCECSVSDSGRHFAISGSVWFVGIRSAAGCLCARLAFARSGAMGLPVARLAVAGLAWSGLACTGAGTLINQSDGAQPEWGDVDFVRSDSGQPTQPDSGLMADGGGHGPIRFDGAVAGAVGPRGDAAQADAERPPSADGGAPSANADANDAPPPSCIPGAETCNGEDEDCDGAIDEGACTTIGAPGAQPTMLTPHCNGATSVTLSWTAVSGAQAYPVRVDDPLASCGSSVSGPGNTGCVGGTEYVLGNPGAYTERSVTLAIAPNTIYQWWVHSYGGAGGWSDYTKRAFSCPADAAAGTAIDVFLVAGQSNAAGWSGSSDGSPAVPISTGVQVGAGSVAAANDPVGNANGGSAWPAFALAYHSATGRPVAFVPAAVPGTGQLSLSDSGSGHWGADGALVDAATWSLDRALITLANSGYRPNLRGVLWSQGENDAIAINDGHLQAGEYSEGLAAMIARYRAGYGSLPFYVFQTGSSPFESDAGYAAVRGAQASYAASDSATHLVFTDAQTFATRGLMRDAYHYTQAAYNEMGTAGGERVAQIVGR